MVGLVKKKKNFKKFILLILLLFVAVMYGVKAYVEKSLGPMDTERPEEITVNIPVGSSTKTIADILKKNNLIRNEHIFKLFVKSENIDGELKSGKYTLNTGMDIEQIASQLKSGGEDDNTVVFTIPEGFEIKDIAGKLSSLGLIDEEKFLNLTSNIKRFQEEYNFLEELPDDSTLEGFLFPDTYDIYKDADEEAIIGKMLSRFEKFYETEFKNMIEKSDLNLNEIVTLASIIEKEARVDEERPIISGVFYNRLEEDMLLQADATVQYALGERKERLYYKDLEVESPYNTYIYKGLPPAPIASPGEKSLIAAVSPSDVDYLYYVLKKDGSGKHIFSKTYEEHLKAKSKQ